MRERRYIRRLLVLVLLIELLGAWRTLRSDLFLRESVNATLNAMGERLGGRFVFDFIEPAGLTGVAIGGLEFAPDGAASESIAARRVSVYPEFSALVRGRLAIARVEVSDLRADVGGALTERIERWISRSSNESRAMEQRLWARASADRLPRDIVVDRADVVVRSSVLRDGVLSFRIEALEVRADDARGARSVSTDLRWSVDGFSRGEASARWRSGDAPHIRIAADTAANWLDLVQTPIPLPTSAAVSLRAIELRGADDVALEHVRVSNLNAAIPGVHRWRLDEVAAERVTVSSNRSSVSVAWGRGSAALAGLLAHPRLAVLEGNLHLDRARSDVDLWLVLGREPQRRMELAIGRSARGDLAVSAVASRYEIDEWSAFFDDDAHVRPLGGRLTGRLEATASWGSSQARIAFHGAIERGSVDISLISAEPLVDLIASFRGDTTVDTKAGELRLNSGQVTLGGVPVSMTGSYTFGTPEPNLVLSAACTDLDAEQLRRGLPRGLAPSLEDTTLAGTLSASLDVVLDAGRPEASTADLSLDVSGVRVVRFSKRTPIDRLDGDFVLDVETHDGRGRTIGPSLDGWVPLAEAGDYLASALTSAEDGRFWTHDGFDWDAILASVEDNLAHRRIVRGGSTITQQVVRSLFLGNERTLGRKFEEAFLSWQLEQVTSKERILELYINSVHWGPGIYGIREAAATYFRRSPSQLTVRESAFLASILSNPDLYGLQYARNIVPESRREKICNVLRNMHNQGDISRSTFEDECRAVRDGEVSIVPVPTWLVDRDPTPVPPSPPQTAQLVCE